MSIEKQMSDRNIMLTGSECFSGLPWPLSTDVKGTKGADIEDDCIGDTNVRGIYTRGVYIQGTYIRSAYIRNTCLRSAGVGVVCVGSACANNTCAKGTCAGNASSTVGACIKSVGPEGICGLFYKPSKSSIEGSKLLVKSISQ